MDAEQQPSVTTTSTSASAKKTAVTANNENDLNQQAKKTTETPNNENDLNQQASTAAEDACAKQDTNEGVSTVETTTIASAKTKSEDTTGTAENSEIDGKVSATTKSEQAKGTAENSENVQEDEQEVEPASLSDVLEALSDIETPGSTCTGGAATSFLPAIPGLYVEGVGPIPLPLTEQSAQMLKNVAEQAPHGRGLETVVDTQVRNTLQVDPAKVMLQNPAWTAALRNLVHHAAQALGVDAHCVRAELYKLLMYETGGFFKKHRDTEKADGMFATLVVQLPSQFTGGSFVVSHNGDTRTFTLGAGQEAAYGCHYVAHYADCEHEIRPVESGYRLALIYSLCYTGPSKIPCADDLSHCNLASVLSRLPPKDSLFVLPLEHQYTTASLARLGAGALKGSDRAKQQAIETAGNGQWQAVICRMSRTDHEWGGGSEYYGFEAEDSEPGEPSLDDIFHSDGSDAKSHSRWMRQQINFESYDQGGMVLAAEDEVEEMWGEGDCGSVEYTGNEGATRDTTYQTYVLIVFSEKSGFERVCTNNFSDAVKEVLQRPDLLDRALRFMAEKKPAISIQECLSLLSLIDFYQLTAEETQQKLSTIVEPLHVSVVPTRSLADALLPLVERFGWTVTTESVRTLIVQRLTECKNLNAANFLKKMDFFLRMATTRESDFLRPVIDLNVKEFQAETDKSSSSTSNYYGYGHQAESSAEQVTDAIVEMTELYGWDVIKPIAKTCFARLRKQGLGKPSQLVARLSALNKLRERIPSCDVESQHQEVVQDFVTAVEKIPTNGAAPSSSYYSYGLRGSSCVLSVGNVDLLARCLFEFGKDGDFGRIERWAATTSLGQLSKLRTIFDRVLTGPLAQTGDAMAVDRCVKAVRDRCTVLKLNELQTRQQKLLATTRGGEPAFSWSMPKANTSSQALTAFLRSPRNGPETIVVGGGINHARQLANAGSDTSYPSYNRYRRYSSPDYIKLGYSATIRSTSGTGRNAAVTVTKTKALHEALVKKYRQDAAELLNVQAEIRNLGGQIQPATAAAAINVDTAIAAPASKRPRTKAPIPADAEILEID